MAGAFTATYQAPSDSARSLGLTQEGYRLRWQHGMDNVDETDGYGRGTWIEGFYQGINVWIGGVFKEWQQGILRATAPFQSFAPSGVTTFDSGIVGRAATNVGGTLILASTAGTPAASSPATLTAAIAIQDSNFNIEPTFGPTHRMTPFLFRIAPVAVSGNTRYFSCT